MEFMVGDLRLFDRFECSGSDMQGQKRVLDLVQEFRSKMQPGGRRCDSPFSTSKNGLISFAVDGVREAGNVRGKRYFADFVNVDDSIKPDQTVAVIANLNDSTRMAMDRKKTSSFLNVLAAAEFTTVPL